MKFRVEVISVNDEGSEQRRDVMEMERDGLAVETLGLSLAEGKAILRGVQDFVASQQTSEDLRRHRRCPNCGQRYHSRAAGTSTVETVFGPVAVPIRGGSLPVSDGRPEDVPAHGDMAARADESGAALLGEQMGLADSLREGGRFIEGSAAGQWVHQSRDGA